MKAVRILLCTVLLVLPIAALSRAPWIPAGASDAVLRFSWRMSVTGERSCRARTQQELDELPVHMRTPEICTVAAATYLLITRVGDAAADTTPLLRGGVKGDRPLFVLQERAVQPGQQRVSVQLVRVTRGSSAILASLDTVLAMQRWRVQLVTLNEADRLIVQSRRD